MLYVKPNGTEIELNDTDASVNYASEHGWEPKDSKPKQPKPKDSKPKQSGK